MEGFRILVSSNTDLLEQKKVFTKEKGLSQRIGLEHHHGRCNCFGTRMWTP